MTDPSPPTQINPRPSGAPAFLWALVGIMAAIELVLSLAEAGYIGTPDWRWSALLVGAFWQPVFSGVVAPVYPGQRAVMCVSYAFLHGGLMHLALNGVVLLSLGKLAASRLGTARTLLVLLLSAVGGALAFGLLAATNVPMIGASGAVFGLIGLWQAWDYGMRREYGLPLRPVISAILALIAANIVLALFLGGGLAWEAHLGGWLVGCLAGQSFARR